MQTLAEGTTFRFDGFLLDQNAGALFRVDSNGGQTPVSLGSRAFRILCLLAERRGAFVSKQDMMRMVWPDVVVEDNNLTVQISALRRVLDHGRDGSCIQTVPGRGYRFVPEVILSPAAITDAKTPEGDAAVTARPTDPHTATWHWRRLVSLGAALCFIAAVLLIVVVWGNYRTAPAVTERPRLSVVVLPFQNLSGDAGENYLADGLTQDLTSDLAHVPGAFVIDGSTARKYGSGPADIRQVGEELGVRYAIEGGVSRVGAMLKVNTDLISAKTGRLLWSDRFDEPFADFASGQEQALGRMRDGLGFSLVELEASRLLHEHTGKPDAFDLLLRGQALRNQPFSLSRRAEALTLYEHALQLDPTSVLAMARTAQNHLNDKMDAGYWPSLEARDRNKALMDRARDIDPNSEAVLTLSTWWQYSEGHCRDTAVTARQLIDRFSNNKNFYFILAACDVNVGPAEAAIPLMQQAALLSPRDPVMYINYRRMGFSSMLIGRDKDAVQWLERSLAIDPEAPARSRHDVYRLLAAVYALDGQAARAREATAKADRLWPFDTVRDHYTWADASADQAMQMKRFRDGLLLSGERDHADENEDFGIPADNALHTVLEGYTPTSAPGATTIDTSDLAKLLSERRPIVLDTLSYFSGRSISGAVGLANAGLGGSFTDDAQARLRHEMQMLASSDMARPVVAVGWNSERFNGRNLALRLVAMGYTHVYWYRGGREAWEAAGLPEANLVPADW